MCKNKTDDDSPSNGLVITKSKLFKNNFVSILHRKSIDDNFNFFEIHKEENRLIFPCDCCIPIHEKCLFKYIMTSQILKCGTCSSYIFFKGKSDTECIESCTHKTFIFSHLTFITIIVFNLILTIYLFMIEYEYKNLHLKYIFSIMFGLLCFFSLIFYIRFINYSLSFRLIEKLKVEERNLSERENLEVKKENFKSSLDNSDKIAENRAVDSAKNFYSYLKLKFDITRGDIIEYRNDNLRKIRIESNIKKKITNILIKFNNDALTIGITYAFKSPKHNVLNDKLFQSTNLRNENIIIDNSFVINNNEGNETDNKFKRIDKKSDTLGSNYSRNNRSDKKQLTSESNKEIIKNEIIQIPSNGDIIIKEPIISSNINLKQEEYRNKYGENVKIIEEMDSFQFMSRDEENNSNLLLIKKQSSKYIKGMKNNQTSQKSIKISNTLKKIPSGIKPYKKFNTPEENYDISYFDADNQILSPQSNEKIFIWAEEKDLTSNFINFKNNMENVSAIIHENSNVTDFSNNKILDQNETGIISNPQAGCVSNSNTVVENNNLNSNHIIINNQVSIIKNIKQNNYNFIKNQLSIKKNVGNEYRRSPLSISAKNNNKNEYNFKNFMSSKTTVDNNNLQNRQIKVNVFINSKDKENIDEKLILSSNKIEFSEVDDVNDFNLKIPEDNKL